MKILHIIDDLSTGGAQSLLVGLAGTQQNQGNDVTILQLVESTDKTISDKIESQGVTVRAIFTKGSLYNPWLIFKISKWANKYDIIHVHLFPALYWVGASKFLHLCKKPTLYTEHSTNNRRRSSSLFRRIDSFIYKHCYNKVICCSDKALETFSEAYPSVKNICVINNGVEVTQYQEAQPYLKKELFGIGQECFVLTMVARFMYMKRQDTIVEAISRLPEKFHAAFVGGDPNDVGLNKVRQYANELSVSHRIHFLYTRTDIPRILKTSDAIIMSSEYEGLSLSSIEGMAAGKPFIATDVNGLREVVKDAGILFKLGNSEQLKDILYKLASNKEYRDIIAQRCVARSEDYDILPMVNKYMKIYNRIIADE